MDMATVLPVVWYFIIGFGVMMYVLLDGFVLGLGILTPFADDEHYLLSGTESIYYINERLLTSIVAFCLGYNLFDCFYFQRVVFTNFVF